MSNKPRPRRSGNPSVDESDVEVVARTLWGVAWADWAEENGELEPGGDIFDQVPVTPDDALNLAAAVIRRVEKLNGKTWEQLYAMARTAPGKHHKKPTPADFAYLLTMEMMETGVGWDDDHPRVDIVLPQVSVHFDGEDQIHAEVSSPRGSERRGSERLPGPYGGRNALQRDIHYGSKRR
jgi:hypothetical protein